ncbi:MAG: tetratricopeptide repeat protein [Sphingomonadales bacterium]|nr:tetratricopeptide repeat protein [Sphingomonadales bacterium]MDE2570423.1 tetratricopeptide repeat protein [Sphingomonadales bacterium]
MKHSCPLALAILLAGCGLSPQQKFDRAQDAYKAHDYLAAKLDLADVLQNDAANWKAGTLLIRSLLEMGDGDATKAALSRLDPAHRPKDYNLLLGEAELLRNQPDAALAAVADAKGAGAERIRAMALLANGDSKGASRAFEAGMAEDAKNPRLLSDYALFTLKEGDTAKARSLVDSALAADPQSLDALLVDGRVATAEGRLDKALASYSTANKAYPNSLAAIAGKAAVLGDLGRLAEMQKVLDSARGMVGSDGALAYLQARAAGARNDWQGARDILQANETALSGKSNATILYAQALEKLGLSEQARARLTPLVSREPGNAEARRLLAAIQMKQGDPKAAATTLAPLAGSKLASASDKRLYADAAKAAGLPNADALAKQARFPTPQSLAAAMANADTAMKRGNWANATAIYEDVLAATNGKNPLVLNNLAYAEGQLGKKDAALRHALAALGYAPKNASVMDTAAWLLYETGADKTRALKLLREAAAADPHNKTIGDHLKAVEANS